MRRQEFPFKIKKQSLYRNSKKDSRKSVLNQTHIVGHGKPEKQISGTKNFTAVNGYHKSAVPKTPIKKVKYDTVHKRIQRTGNFIV